MDKNRPRPDASVEAQAAAWLARMRSDERNEADLAGFQTWLAESELNRQTFDLLTNAWEIAGQAAALEGAPHPAKPAVVDRRLVLAGSAAAVTAVGLGLYGTRRFETFGTRLGEQRRIELADGSVLLLDTDTEVRFSMGRTRRAELVRGRGHFLVAKNTSHPFVVDMDGYRVRVTGTEFDLVREPALRSVVLVEGSVVVESPGGGGETLHRTLRPGERLIFHGSALAQEDRPNLAAVTAWQSGRIILDEQPLAYAVTEINKYHRRKLVVSDPELARMPISGVYEIDDPDGFAISVSNLLPVKIESGNEQLLLRPR